MLVMFKEVKIEISHDVTRILGHFLQIECIVLLQSTMLLFGGRYTTPVMYVWPLRWFFAKTHSIWSLTISSSERWVYVNFQLYTKTHHLPFATTWLIQHACIHLYHTYQMRMEAAMFQRDQLLENKGWYCSYNTLKSTSWRGHFWYLHVARKAHQNWYL